MSYKPIRSGTAQDWIKTDAGVFWGEIAPADHVLQVYTSEDVFIDSLMGFIGTGVNNGDCVVVIATKQHLDALHTKLTSLGVQVATLVADDRYIPLAADVTLSKFMVDGMPDEALLRSMVMGLVNRAQRKGRKLRAFGEMVALLLADGNIEATIKLEEMWSELSTNEQFSLFCAYPADSFPGNMAYPANRICSCHTKMITGSEKQLQQVYFKETAERA